MESFVILFALSVATAWAVAYKRGNGIAWSIWLAAVLTFSSQRELVDAPGPGGVDVAAHRRGRRPAGAYVPGGGRDFLRLVL